MLVGYVSDERFMAIADCLLLFERDGKAVEARSSANGAVYAELAPGTRLLAKGLNPDDGGAEMVVHETEIGGAIFAVGSICWPSSFLVDAGVSQITANVVRRFIH
jgi:hypothetical protein